MCKEKSIEELTVEDIEECIFHMLDHPSWQMLFRSSLPMNLSLHLNLKLPASLNDPDCVLRNDAFLKQFGLLVVEPIIVRLLAERKLSFDLDNPNILYDVRKYKNLSEISCS